MFERFTFKQIPNFMEPSRNNSVVFQKATAHNIAFYPCLENGNQQLIKILFWCAFDRFNKGLSLRTFTCKVVYV